MSSARTVTINPIIIRIKSPSSDASVVLARGGYIRTNHADHSDDDRFEKDGRKFKFAFPIWEMDPTMKRFTGVRIEPA